MSDEWRHWLRIMGSVLIGGSIAHAAEWAQIHVETPYEAVLADEELVNVVILKNSGMEPIPLLDRSTPLSLFSGQIVCSYYRAGRLLNPPRSVVPLGGDRWGCVVEQHTRVLYPNEEICTFQNAWMDAGSYARLDADSVAGRWMIGPEVWVESERQPLHVVEARILDFPVVASYTKDEGAANERVFDFRRVDLGGNTFLYSQYDGLFPKRFARIPEGVREKITFSLDQGDWLVTTVSFPGTEYPDLVLHARHRVLSGHPDTVAYSFLRHRLGEIDRETYRRLREENRSKPWLTPQARGEGPRRFELDDTEPEGDETTGEPSTRAMTEGSAEGGATARELERSPVVKDSVELARRESAERRRGRILVGGVVVVALGVLAWQARMRRRATSSMSKRKNR